MADVNLAVADFGQTLGLPSLALDTQGCANLKIGDALWTLQSINDGEALLVVHTMDAPFSTASQIESALQACHAHMQPMHAPGMLRLGTRGRGAAAQWVGSLRLHAPADGQAIARALDDLLQWMRQRRHDAGLTGNH
jgi:Tir chaperone protein (CesT) family